MEEEEEDEEEEEEEEDEEGRREMGAKTRTKGIVHFVHLVAFLFNAFFATKSPSKYYLSLY